MASAASRMAGKLTRTLGDRIGSSVQQLGRGLKSAALSSSPGLAGLGGLAQKLGRVSGTELKLGEQKQVQQQMITNKQLDNLVSETKKSYAAQRDAVLAATETLEQIKLLREQGAYQHQELVEAVKEGGNGEGDDDSKTKKLSRTSAVIEGAKTVGKVIGGLYIAYEAYDAIVRAFGTPVRYGKGLKAMGMGPGQHVARGTGPGNRTYFGPPPGKGGPGVFNLAMPPDYKKGFAPAVMPGTGSQINIKPKPVLVEDEKVAKAIEEQSKTLAKTEENTKISAGVSNDVAKREKIRETRAKPTRAEKILGDAQAKFLKGFEDTTTKIFREGLEKLLPEPGVSASTAAGEMYRGQTLRQMTGLDKAANKIFGKEYGPLFAELGTAYLEVGASSLAENFFASTFGTDEKGALKSRTVGGQILGNLAAGKKTRAAESLVYGLTGIPTGAESLANYMGFSSAKEGVGFVADVLGAATTEFLRPAGMQGPAATYTDPRTGQTYSYGGGFMDILSGRKEGVLAPMTSALMQKQRTKALQARSVSAAEGGGIAGVSALMTEGIATMPVTIVGDETLQQSAGSVMDAIGMPPEYKKGFVNTPLYSGGVTPDDVAHSTVDTSETIHQLYENTDEWGSKNEVRDYSIADQDIATQQQVGTGIMGTFNQVGTFLMGGLTSIRDAIFSRPAGGGGTSVSVGGFGGGDFMSMMGNVIGTTLIATGVNKLTSKIKDPNLRMIANIGLNVAGQKYLLGNLGGVGGTGRSIFSGANPLQTGGIIPFDPLSYLGQMSANMGFASGANFFAGMSSVGQGAAFPSAATYGTAGQLGYMAGQVLPYTDAIIRGFKGDFGGAAASALGTYGVAQLGIAATGSSLGASAFLMANPLWAAGALIVGSLLGGLFGKKPKKPVVERSLAIRGNNDPKAIITVQERHKDMSDTYVGLDSLLQAAFNNLKLVEKKTGKTPFTHTSIFIRAGSDTIFCLYRESELNLVYNPRGDKWGGIKYHKQFGKPDNAFKTPGTLVKQIVDFINASLREELGASEESNIAEAANIINRKGFAELTTSTIRELENLNPELSDAYGAGGYMRSSFDALEEKRLELQRQGLVGESGFESAETTNVSRTETVSEGDSNREVTTTTREPVGIVDVGTGQIVPYGTDITYTEADGTQKTITLNRDAIGANKIVAIENGIPIFDLGAGSAGRFDYQDYVAHGRRYNILDLTQPNTFLEEVQRLDPLTEYQMETYGQGLRTSNTGSTTTSPAIVAPTTNNNDNSQTVTIQYGSFNSDDTLKLTVSTGG